MRLINQIMLLENKSMSKNHLIIWFLLLKIILNNNFWKLNITENYVLCVLSVFQNKKIKNTKTQICFPVFLVFLAQKTVFNNYNQSCPKNIWSFWKTFPKHSGMKETIYMMLFSASPNKYFRMRKEHEKSSSPRPNPI